VFGSDSINVQNSTLHNIKIIYSNASAFAALTNDGYVVTWGDPHQDDGGNSMTVHNQLKDIKMIFSTDNVFAALTTEGNVVTWGNQVYGGNYNTVQNQLKNVKMIFSNDRAFAALM
jgi:uncharacterized membrane protein